MPLNDLGLASAWQDTAVPCPDTECVDWAGKRSMAEPDGDSELRWYECLTCGYEFGHERTDESKISNESGSCQVGIPESLRREASAGAERALRQLADDKPILQIGRRPGG